MADKTSTTTTTNTSTTPPTDDDDHQPSNIHTANTSPSNPHRTPPHRRSPGDHSHTTTTSNHDAPLTNHNSPPSPQTRRSTPVTSPACGCTKIATMQLFHEMKQVFATVPDYLVCQYVADNCHNRPALIEHLQRETARQPSTVQAYPQALRNKCHPLTATTVAPHELTPATVGHKPNCAVDCPIDDTAPRQQHQQQHIETKTTNHNRPAIDVSSATSMASRPHRPPPSPPAPAERRRFGLLRNAAAAADAPIKPHNPCFDQRPIDPDNAVQQHLSPHHRSPSGEAALSAQPDRIGSSVHAASPKPFATQQTLDLRYTN